MPTNPDTPKSSCSREDLVVRRRVASLTLPQIDALLAFLPRVEGPEPDARVEIELVQHLYDQGWIVPFDWPTWTRQPAGRLDVEEHPDVDLAHLLRLLTAHVRQERFCEGHLACALSDGAIAKILRRLRALRSTRVLSSFPSRDELRAHQALVGKETRYQSRLRLHQAKWREAQMLPIGSFQGREYGNLLRMPDAEHTLANYLDPDIRAVVRREVLDSGSDRGRLFAPPRIFNNLLSSQPLCFNLFGPLALDKRLATRLLGELDPAFAAAEAVVTKVAFEYSPGRGDPRYTGDRSAFDVFIEYTKRSRRGFLGIEVKYHEDLTDPEANISRRHHELAESSLAFHADRYAEVQRRPLHQIWRDHLLALSMLQAGDYDEGRSIVLFPRDNLPCARAVTRYRACLRNANTFGWWTLEEIVLALEDAEAPATWLDALRERYLSD